MDELPKFYKAKYIRGSLSEKYIRVIRVKPSAKTVLTPLGLTVAALTTDVAIQKKIYDSGTTLIWKKISWKYLNLLKNLVYW